MTTVHGADSFEGGCREVADSAIGLGNTRAMVVKCTSKGATGTDSEVGFIEAVTSVDDMVDLVYAVVDSTS